MKLKLLTLPFLVLMMLSTNSYAQGVPVIDPAQIGNQIQQWLKEAKEFTEHMDKVQEGIELDTEQLAAMTGIRDIQQFMNEANDILNQVDDLANWVNRQEEIFTHGKDILDTDLRKIFDSYNLTNICESKGESEKKSCEGEIIVDVIKQKNNEQSLKQLEKRIETIDDIAKRMANSKDHKESLDLANAMSTQMTLLEADKIKMDIQSSIDEFQLRILEKRREDEIQRLHNIHDVW